MKSPAGYNYPYYYKNGELHCLKFGNFNDDKKSLLKLMKEETEFVAARMERINIWIDFYETNISKNVINALYESVIRMQNNIKRLAIVGLNWINKVKIKNKLKDFNFPIQFFNDPELAKTWIIFGKLDN